MPASRCSSDRLRFGRVRAGSIAGWIACALAIALTGAALSGCVTVRPEQREHLADPAMTFGSEGEAGAHEAHVLSNREGSYGAAGVTGGGCGCN